MNCMTWSGLGIVACAMLLIHLKQVKQISDVFRFLYRYEVREIPLPHRQKVDLWWPWEDPSLVDERDLQIMYYLGNTVSNPSRGDGQLGVTATPVKQAP